MSVNFQMVEEEEMGSCVITMGTSHESVHVITTSFALAQQARKMLLQYMKQIRCCAQVRYYHDSK